MEAHTKPLITTSDKVKAMIAKGMKKGAIADMVGISRPTLDKKLADNSWTDSEIGALQLHGLI